jgi:hypothetical protein
LIFVSLYFIHIFNSCKAQLSALCLSSFYFLGGWSILLKLCTLFRGGNYITILCVSFQIGLRTIPTGIRPENPRELTGKMFQYSGFITSHLKKFLKILRCEAMNSEFWNIFPVSSRGFSGRIPVGIVPSPNGFPSSIFSVKLRSSYLPLLLRFYSPKEFPKMY